MERMRHGVGALLVLALAASLTACGGGEPERYVEFRQAEREEIPGTWGLVIEPPEEGWNPELSPTEVLDRFAADTPRESIMLSLANITSEITYVSDGTPHPVASQPAWVFMSRGVCFSTEKGALVASARRPDSYNPERCSMKNISVLAVHADTGEFITTGRGFEETLDWSPARRGNPTNPGSSTAPGTPSPRPAARSSDVHSPAQSPNP